MKGQAGFWDIEHSLAQLSAEGDPLEKLSVTVDFEIFRPVLAKAVRRSDPAKGGRPGFDVVLKFKIQVQQSLHGLSLQQLFYLVCDRLRWMRFCGLGPGDAVPDVNTLWDFREALIAAKALDGVLVASTRPSAPPAICPCRARSSTALVAAPRQRNSDGEKEANKAGQTARDIWPDKPAKAAQKDVDDRWTIKFAKAKPAADGTPRIDIAIPTFGYEAHISIDRRHGVIRRRIVTDAAAHDGTRLLEGLIDPNNTASDVWADTAYRSEANEAFLRSIGKVSRIHVKKPRGKPMSRRTAAANVTKSAVRAHVEHPFVVLKGPMRLVVRTIGEARAEATITLAAMAYNMKRWCWLDRRSLPA